MHIFSGDAATFSIDITGTEITSYNSYKIHELKNNDTNGQTTYTFTTTGCPESLDFLIVASGGGIVIIRYEI